MSNLSWATNEGTVANVIIGVPASVAILAANVATNDITLSYKIISGSLPTGLTMSAAGIISGTPDYLNTTQNYFSKQTYSFIVRVTSSDQAVLDGSFKIILSNVLNRDFNWITPSGSLGTVPDGTFYSLQLQVFEAQGSPVTFSFISGEIPPGMSLLTTGYLQGVPTLLTPTAVNESTTFSFTVRATNSLGHINDRGFSLTVTNVYGPIITPITVFLGSVFDGSYYNQRLEVISLNPNVDIEWSVTNGVLPTGVELVDQGGPTATLTGYIQPVELVGDYGPAGFDSDLEEGGVVIQRQEYDGVPYDFNQLNQSLSYNFTIQAYDGANYDLQDYVLSVTARSGFTADSTNPINDTYLTIDSLNIYPPVLLNTSTTLPTARQDSYYAFKFDGIDFEGDTLTYEVVNTTGTFDAFVTGADEGFDYAPFDSFDQNNAATSNLPGLILDARTGWLYGKLDPQDVGYRIYTFGVQVSKVRNGITFYSRPMYFNLPILGDVNNVIQWITPEDLGTINNGIVSELFVEARNLEGANNLVYSLYDRAGVPIRLPQGLTLLPNGEISGRVSFETTEIDLEETTFDGNRLTLDRIYNFTVLAQTSDGSVENLREFTLKINVINLAPYENLYLKAMPAYDQRQIFKSVTTNQEIFPPALIYRADDPWFGISNDISMLFLPGLTPTEIDDYQTAMIQNHYTKTYNFGEIKSVVVLDNNFEVKYEVVYIEVVDPAENSAGVGPGLEINLTDVIANPYIDGSGNEYKIVYPNTSDDMIARIEQSIDYNDRSSLPDWMTSNQPDPNNTNKFLTPLGYTKAAVIAYTKPGAGKLIAYRLRNSGINFNNIEFTVDRYQVDDYYSANYNKQDQEYYTGRETTFDFLPNTNIGTLVASVNYAVTVPFTQINGRSISYINSSGGIDGETKFRNGETLVFAKQENFSNPGPYDGWVRYFDSYIGDNITTPEIEGYDSGLYDDYIVIPGFFENSLDPTVDNQRGGTWRINIVNNIVSLEPVLYVALNERIRVLNGMTYGGAILYYNIQLAAGQSVPYYSVYKYNPNLIRQRTTFNGDSTKFFSFRDQYYTPGSQDKYVKFPQYGVFT